jgi:hypothetical protein
MPDNPCHLILLCINRFVSNLGLTFPSDLRLLLCKAIFDPYRLTLHCSHFDPLYRSFSDCPLIQSWTVHIRWTKCDFVKSDTRFQDKMVKTDELFEDVANKYAEDKSLCMSPTMTDNFSTLTIELINAPIDLNNLKFYWKETDQTLAEATKQQC